MPRRSPPPIWFAPEVTRKTCFASGEGVSGKRSVESGYRESVNARRLDKLVVAAGRAVMPTGHRYVSNLLDKTYVARCSGPAGCVYGASREVIATVTKKF